MTVAIGPHRSIQTDANYDDRRRATGKPMNQPALVIFLATIVVLHDGAAVAAGWPESVPVGSPLLEPLPAVQNLPDLGSASLPTAKNIEWWASLVASPLRPGGQAMPLTLHQLAIETITHSQQVQALRVSPQIRQTQVIQADAEFDPVAFVDSKWFDRDEPVGSFLTTGGKPRLLEDTFTENIGVRRKTRSGASVEIAQRLGLQDSNSTFFVPSDQAQTRLAISVTQPLLRGAGRAVNESFIVLADHDVRIADDVFAEGLQDQLLRVAKQYWELFFQRSLVLQQGRNLERAHAILRELESRQAIDALRSQIERAKAKVATREAGWLRAQASVRNAEATLRSLVNSPALDANPNLELTPVDVPRRAHIPISLPFAKQIAFAQRPEIDNLLTQIRAASVRLSVAHNQVLPSLALVVETYVNGLQGDYEIAKSFGDQFSKGAPSYSAGLVFEVPIGNRRAKAQTRQRQLELNRYYLQLNTALGELATEVEIALREVDITHAELVSRRTSLVATASEVEYLYQRWRRLPGHDQSASFFLEDLLNAEDRLVSEEQRVAASQTGLAIAQVELKRAMGKLVVSEPCDFCQEDSMPMPPLSIDAPVTASDPVNLPIEPATSTSWPHETTPATAPTPLFDAP